jgi:nitrogenase molybdenum-iron protein alpha/beta subunit
MRAEPHLELPFLNGVYVAVDALRRCYLIVDGPYCVFTKAEMQYCHNLNCHLLPHLGHARVVHTASDSLKEEVASAVLDRTKMVERIFDQVCSLADADIVLTTSFDFHQLLNFPLEAMAERFAKDTSKLVCHVRSRSLGGTWLQGYGLVCETLAQAIPLQQGRRRRDAVAVVGYLFDRDEPDHRGNLEELRRMLHVIGLDLSTVWLSGEGLQALQSVQEAGLILSLPYARDAARILAERLGADLLEVDLPIGLQASEQMLQTVARHVGREELARQFLDKELASAVGDTQRHVLRIISTNTARLVCNDPHLEQGLTALCGDLGLRIVDSSAPAEAGVLRCHELCFSPTLSPPSPQGVHIPMGYPNYIDHPVVNTPLLGFAGFRNLVDRIAAAILRFEASAAHGLQEPASAQRRPDDG